MAAKRATKHRKPRLLEIGMLKSGKKVIYMLNQNKLGGLVVVMQKGVTNCAFHDGGKMYCVVVMQ